ncbi:MAG: hypothetical protein AB1641_17715 [Thermodesulfobacteriota bacterium]
MEKAVEELKALMRFKDSTSVGDVVLMLNETGDENEPINAAYAVVTDFVRDISKRDEWWHVHFSFLAVPPVSQMLILQTPHFTGREIFTIGGRKVFIKALDFSPTREPEDGTISPKEKIKTSLRLVK